MAADAALLADLSAMTPAECRVAIRTAANTSAEVLAEDGREPAHRAQSPEVGDAQTPTS